MLFEILRSTDIAMQLKHKHGERYVCFIANLLIDCSFNKLRLQKEELEQKHLHLLQIVESEKTAKWQYTQQCEELMSEIKKLRAEVS